MRPLALLEPRFLVWQTLVLGQARRPGVVWSTAAGPEGRGRCTIALHRRCMVGDLFSNRFRRPSTTQSGGTFPWVVFSSFLVLVAQPKLYNRQHQQPLTFAMVVLQEIVVLKFTAPFPAATHQRALNPLPNSAMSQVDHPRVVSSRSACLFPNRYRWFRYAGGQLVEESRALFFFFLFFRVLRRGGAAVACVDPDQRRGGNDPCFCRWFGRLRPSSLGTARRR